MYQCSASNFAAAHEQQRKKKSDPEKPFVCMQFVFFGLFYVAFTTSYLGTTPSPTRPRDDDDAY